MKRRRSARHHGASRLRLGDSPAFKTVRVEPPPQRSKAHVKDVAELVDALKRRVGGNEQDPRHCRTHGAKLNPSTSKCVTCASRSAAARSTAGPRRDGSGRRTQAAALAGVGKVLVAAMPQRRAAGRCAGAAGGEAGHRLHARLRSVDHLRKDLMRALPRCSASASDRHHAVDARTPSAPDLRRQRRAHARSAADAIVVATVRVASFEEAAQGGRCRGREGRRRRRPAVAHALRLALRATTGRPTCRAQLA